MDKLDNWFIEVITKITVRWIKKHKYTKHKYDFFIVVTGWEMAYWVAQIGFTFIRGSHSVSRSALWAGVMAFIILMEYLKLHQLQSIKQFYDELWERRKNPLVYKAVKDLVEHNKNETHHRKPRQFMIKMLLGTAILLGILNPLITPVYLFFVFSLYHECIFDFDPPDKKEKKVKDSVTDLVMNSWRNLIGALAPAKG